MGNKTSSVSEPATIKAKPTMKFRKMISRVTSRSANFSEAERNKARLASMRLKGVRPQAEFYLSERVLTDSEIGHIMVRLAFDPGLDANQGSLGLYCLH